MDDFDQLVKTISMTMGAAWGAGINLYATVLVLGFLGMTGNITLPQGLEVLMNPLVMGAAGFMYMVEFFADKMPGVDTGWDTLHTFIRIPAGAMLAVGAVGDLNPAMVIAAGILGGGLATSTHAAKAGSRLLINASPEPITNWTASVVEDVTVIAGIWAALTYPLVYLVALVIFLLFLIWFLPRLWVGIKRFFAYIRGVFNPRKQS